MRQINRTYIRNGKVVSDPIWDAGHTKGEPVEICLPDRGWTKGSKIGCQVGTSKVLVLVPHTANAKPGVCGKFTMWEADWTETEVRRLG